MQNSEIILYQSGGDIKIDVPVYFVFQDCAQRRKEFQG
jgi:hypothetical protein